ncbi:peptidase U35 phage prohead HK97 [Cupriavidus sp. HMR-1]|uniref:phage major capsid family protein n=1 Tax=Cupriavidus sp. HMR-1 TaxID=1249621 RepID=UPI0002A216DC|nr:phage major capsid protein [Cupriavidus sp. HMR-1]ELA00625.1 peptidase U35 phage prohead HK97 [Cupriavidus sp. HMR-1]
MSRNPQLPTMRSSVLGHAFAIAVVAHARKWSSDAAREVFLQKSDPSGLAVLILKAAQNPADSVTSDWASGLISPQMVLDYIGTLPQTAGAQILGLAQVQTPLYQDSRLIYRQTLDGTHQWVVEGGPIPVVQLDIGAGTLVQGKLSAIVVATTELIDAPNAASTLEQLLAEDAALSLDTALLSDTAATDHPEGLLAGAVSVTGSASAEKDVKALLEAVPDILRPVFVSNRAQSVGLFASSLAANGRLVDCPLLYSPKLKDGELMVMDAQDFATAGGASPQIETRREGFLHLDDNPQPIAPATGGTAVLASPTSSIYQQDLVAIKSRLPLGWGWRRTGRVAKLTGATW